MNIVELSDKFAMTNPNQLAIIEANTQITFSELTTNTKRGANFFTAHQLEKGDVVLIFVPMSVELYSILISLWRCGIVAMFLDPSSSKEQFEYCFNLIKPKAFIGIPKAHLLRLLSKPLKKIPLSFSTGFFPFVKRWHQYSKCSNEHQILNCQANDAALITFTSGSTGQPKGAIRTHSFLIEQHKVLQNTLKLSPGSIDLATLPVFALINLASGISTLIPNADLMSPGKVDPEPILKQIQEYKPQSAVASPAFFECLLASEKATSLKYFKKIFTGGAPVFPKLMKDLQAKIPNGLIVSVYGSTEAEPISEIAYTDFTSEDFQKMSEGKGLLNGHPARETDCRVIQYASKKDLSQLSDQEFDKLICLPNQPGEIIVTGRHVLKGYVNGVGDNENKIKLQNEIWHRTSDMGYFDDKGRLWLLGRCAATINDSNGTLYPFAIETATKQLINPEKVAVLSWQKKRILIIETNADQQKMKESLKSILKDYFIEELLFMRIPFDKRHNAKVNYPELHKLLEKKLGKNLSQ